MPLPSNRTVAPDEPLRDQVACLIRAWVATAREVFRPGQQQGGGIRSPDHPGALAERPLTPA